MSKHLSTTALLNLKTISGESLRESMDFLQRVVERGGKSLNRFYVASDDKQFNGIVEIIKQKLSCYAL